MSYSIDKTKNFPYAVESLNSFKVYIYEWIDNLHFTISPADCLDNYAEYEHFVEKIFLKAGWDGDGEIKFMWLPPFVLPDSIKGNNTKGITIFHVKQEEDGISFLLSPIPLDFLEAFKQKE